MLYLKRIGGDYKMNKFMDLHMHSLYSDDGEFTPSELIKKCHDKKVY